MQSNEWLIDETIDNYLNFIGSQSGNENFLMISCTVTAMIKLLPTEESQIHLESLDPKNKELIFFPLNNTDGNFSSGTHWSLVVYSKKEDAFFSFDSMGEYNFKHAKHLHWKLKILLDTKGSLNICSSTRQHNTFDCGVFVVLNSQGVVNHYKKEGNVKDTPKVICKNPRQKILEMAGL